MKIIDEILNKTQEVFNNLYKNAVKDLSESKQVIIKIFMIIFPLIIIIIIINLIISGIRNGNCLEVRKELSDYIDSYVMSNNLLPTINGDNIEINLNDVKKVTFNDEICTGTVKITKVNDDYIKTFNLENCSYCRTDNFGKEKNDYDGISNVDVVVYINYYNVTNNNSRWSDYIPFEKISTEETNGVMLPLSEEDLPEISEEAIITEIIKEDKIFYSYRDKRWLWYKNYNENYSDFSSEQPAGYSQKDEDTETRTEYSEWAIDYPEEKSYREITSSTGYRWYKKDDNGDIIWWNNGEFYPTKPEDGYYKDNESKITMYRYYDYEWKWYNGTKREYSSKLSSTPPTNSYKYKDEDITSYSDWSNYVTYSSLNSDNITYREEITNTHSRYMIKYKIRSLLVLNEALERKEFEETTGRTLEEMYNDPNIDLEITFKYKYQ